MEQQKSRYLICEVLEQWHVSPPFHICTLELADLLVFGLFGVFVERPEQVFVDDEVLIPLLIVNFDIRVVGVHAEGEVRWERPRRRCPRQK